MTAPGPILNQRFRLDRLIGQGGFARVYLSTDLLLDRQVAVKILSPNQIGADTAPFLQRFGAEARLIARLEHPNILGLYDYGQSDDLAYLVMPYVAGGSLHDARRLAGRFTPAQVTAYLRQIASALDYAHRNNIVHRDIKPQNMLLRGDQLLVADFGIAKVLSDDSSQSGTAIVGSTSYMAPEQFQGRVGRATDTYALGCVVFELLTGAPPYPGPAERTMFGHVWGEIPRLAATLPDAPPALQAVLDRALAKQPEARFASAGELSEAFAAALVAPSEQITRLNSPVPSPPPPPPAMPPVVTASLPPRSIPPLPAAAPPPAALSLPPVAAPAPPGNRRLVIGLVSALVALLILLGIGGALLANRQQPTAPGDTPTPKPTVVAAVPTVAPKASSAAASAAPPASVDPTATISVAPTPASLVSRTAIQLGAHTERVTLSLWSPDGQYLATASEDNTAHWWRKDGQSVRTLNGHTAPVRALAWSPDGQYLATGGEDGEVLIWQQNRDDPVRVAGDGYGISTLAWSPDGKLLIAASGVLRSIQAGTWIVGKTVERDDSVTAMAWSPDGRLLAVGGSSGSLKVYGNNGDSVTTLVGHTADVIGLSWSPDSARLASVGGNVLSWDAKTLQRVAQLSGHTDQVSSVAWSRDGKLLATGAADSTVRLWQPDGTLVRTLAGHELGPVQVAWLRDGTLVSGDSASILRWWATDGTLISQGKTSGCGATQLAAAPVELLVAVTQDCQPPQIWR